ncbi:MAG TPA: alpha/beta hydrolase [Arachidicoccus sp.]|nr:alpha/beta hydrolase [Arachidicoccus sp.]
MAIISKQQLPFNSGYADVNGLSMYYEIYGEGKRPPLVLIHGGGSTIQTSFSNIIPLLAVDRQVIAMELQAHGRTGDRQADLSFRQDADDIVALLRFLKIERADFLGYSNGGQTLIELALRPAEVMHKIIIASAFYKRSAAPPAFWEGFDHATLDMMPQVLKANFLAVNNSEAALQNMFNKDVQRMKTFEDWSDAEIISIKSPTLIISGNNDVGSIEHQTEMYKTFPNAALVILPGMHGAYMGTLDYLGDNKWHQKYTADIITDFLDH